MIKNIIFQDSKSQIGANKMNWKALIIEIESENANIDKTVRWKPIRHLVILGVGIMVEKYKGKIYVQPYSERKIGKFKMIREVNITEKFALATIQEGEKNILFQTHLEEFDSVIELE